MSIRGLMATAAAGLALATGAGQMNSLEAQNAAADFRADNAFVSQVAASNLLEVRLGQTAEGKAETPRVKQYAAKMVNDHTSSQQQWMAVARKHGVPFNARLSSEQEQQMERLRGLSGREFEVAYMDQMVQNHQTNLNTFTTQGRSARSADTRELVERGILMIGEHSRLATQIRGEIGGAAVAANPPAQQQPAAQPTTPWENVKRDPPRQQPGQPAPQPTAEEPRAGQTARVDAQARAAINKDAQFVRDVSAHHFLEQRLGELAARKAQSEQVKEYGRRTANDHADMEKHWINMARNNGMTLDAGMGKDHRAKLTRLEKKSGRSFDREYMSLEVSNHKGYLNALMREGRRANSADVRELVDRVIPTETNHFNLAKRVGAQVDADTSAQLRTTSAR